MPRPSTLGALLTTLREWRRQSWSPLHTAVMVACLLLAVTTLAPIATGHDDDLHDAYQLYFADDNDINSSPDDILNYTVDDMLRADGSIEHAARSEDFAFTNASPEVEVGGYNLSAYRKNHLPNINGTEYRVSQFPVFTKSAARYRGMGSRDLLGNGPKTVTEPEEQRPELQDRGRLRDMHVTVLGAEAGVRPLPGTDENLYNHDNDEASNQPLLIPANGSVYSYFDFRHNNASRRIDRTCHSPNYEYSTRTREIDGNQYQVRERTGGTQTCTVTTIGQFNASQTLYINGEQVGEATSAPEDSDEVRDASGSAIINYSNASGTGLVPLRVVGTVRIEQERINETFEYDPDNGGWQQTPVSNETVGSTNVTRSVQTEQQVIVTTNQELTINQRVVEFENRDENIILVDVTGPRDLTERRLWSRLRMNDSQYVRNVWGVYGTQQYYHWEYHNVQNCEEERVGGLFGGCDTQTIHQPDRIPQLRLNAMRSGPEVVLTGRAQPHSRAELIDWYGSNWSDSNATYIENVSLESRAPVQIASLKLRNAPDQITRAEDIHGDPIPIENTTVPGRVPEITFTEQGDNQIRVKVTDPQTGDPLPNRQLYLEGAEEDTAMTGSDGSTIVSRTGLELEVQTEADRVADTRHVYYASAVATKVFLTSTALLELAQAFVWRLVLAAPFIGFYIWLKNMKKTDIRG